MKIVIPGKTPPKMYWWTGKQHQCTYCNQVIELEENDDRNISLIFDYLIDGRECIKWKCGLCGTICLISESRIHI
jgi:hypothetical protein